MPTKLKIKQVYPEPISASTVENNYVDLNTKQVITEEKYFQKSFTLTRDTSTYNWQDIVKFNGEPVEGDYNRVGSIRFSTNLTTQAHTVALNAITKGENDANASFGTISVTINPDKTVTTYAPTPSTNDNSTKIATTAFVKAQNYITASSDITGNAATSTKLATARNISAGNLDFTGSANFDGSGNITLNATPYYATITVGNTNNYPYHYIGTTGIITSSYIDKVINLLVTRDYIDGGSGIVRIEFRTNNASGGATGSCSVRWLCRDNHLPVDCIQVGFRNTAADSIADIFYKSAGTYNSAVVRVLSSGSRGNINRAFTLVNSSEVSNTTTSDKLTSVGAYKAIADAVTDLHSGKTYTSTITASDNAVVQYANTINGYTMDLNTNNTTATWVPVLQGTTWQHRVIPADAKFTDTVTTVTTSGTGNAVTAITESNGALTVTKGTTFLTSHQSLAAYLPLAGGTTTGAIKCVAKNLGSSYVNAAKDGGAIISMTNTDSFGAWLTGYTKSYKVALATYPGSNEEVQLYSITKANVTAGTNTANKFLKWNASTGALTSDSFVGALTGNVTGNCSGTAANVTGTVAIANGGTGATTRLAAIKNLTNENVSTNATHFLGLKSDWSKVGYFTLGEAKTLLGLKSAAYTESSAYATSGHTHSYLPLSGGTLTGRLTINTASTSISGGGMIVTGAGQNYAIQIQNTNVTKGTAPSATAYSAIEFYGATRSKYQNRLALLEQSTSTANLNSIKMTAYNPTSAENTGTCAIGCYVNASGTAYTSAPTPAASDNSTKIATTAFVNNRLPYTTGTWTPTLSGSTTAGSFTYSYTGGGRECYYVKFGNLVFLRAAFSYTITSAPAGEVRINGAPFVSDSYYKGLGGGNTRRWQVAQIGLNSSYIRPQVYKSDLSGSNIPTWGSSDSLTTWLNTVNSSDWIIFSIWYSTNS